MHVVYVRDHPGYIEAIVDRPGTNPKGKRKRKSIQALIAHASKEAKGFKDVYAELSEATHFGSLAMWASIHPEEDRHISWTSYPRFRPGQGEIACAQILELADAMEIGLRRIAGLYLGAASAE